MCMFLIQSLLSEFSTDARTNAVYQTAAKAAGTSDAFGLKLNTTTVKMYIFNYCIFE